MNRLYIGVGVLLLVVGLNIGGANAARTVENRISTDYEPKKPASYVGPTLIDDIPIPHEILVYAQVVYQGYAITQAEETTWNGKKAFQVRIDNDSNPNDGNGMYLLYDEDWELIDEKPLYAPLPKNRKSGTKKPEPKPEVTAEPVQEESPAEEEPEANPKPDKPEQGSDDTDKPEPQPTEDSDEEGVDSEDDGDESASSGDDVAEEKPEPAADDRSPAA